MTYTEGWPKWMNSQQAQLIHRKGQGIEVVPLSDAERLREDSERKEIQRRLAVQNAADHRRDAERMRVAAENLEDVVDRLLEWHAHEDEPALIDYPEREQEAWADLIAAAADVLPAARAALNPEQGKPLPDEMDEHRESQRESLQDRSEQRLRDQERT